MRPRPSVVDKDQEAGDAQRHDTASLTLPELRPRTPASAVASRPSLGAFCIAWFSKPMMTAGRRHRRRNSRGKQPHQNRLRLRRSILICAISCQRRGWLSQPSALKPDPRLAFWRIVDYSSSIKTINQYVNKKLMSERHLMMKLRFNQVSSWGHPPQPVSAHRA